MSFIIEADQVCIDYRLGQQWVNAVRQVSLQIAPLEIHGLVGESGSGKSTLALALMGYLAKNSRISDGDIRFEGQSLLQKTAAEMRHIWGKCISLVPQDPLAALNPSQRIGDQIAEVTQLHDRLASRAAWRKAVEMLERVRIADPESVARKYPHQLSGGMQQRVTIAMALSTQPKLLILDEPTTALDVTTEATILDLFRDLIRENEAAALYVSHNLGVIAQMCDRMTVLYAGEVMASGTVEQLYSRPIHPYTIGLLASIPRPTSGHETRLPTMDGIAPSLSQRPSACVFAPRCPVAQPICFSEKPPLETIGEGRRVKCHRWQEIAQGELMLSNQVMALADETPAPSPHETILEAAHLVKQFGSGNLLQRLMGRGSSKLTAVDDVSIAVHKQSTLGLVGESGSGKTTLARCIIGLETADHGTLDLLDMPVPPALAGRSQTLRRNLQMVFQNPNDTLNPYRTIGQALERTIRQLSEAPPTSEAVREQVSALLNRVRLPDDYQHRYPSELSGGEKQRVAIARAFATQPALVIADEPTSALDVSVQAVILNLLKDLRGHDGASYLFISHDLRAVSYLADWIAVMYLGQIVEEGTVDQFNQAPSHPYTEALLSAIPEPDPTRRQGHIRLDGDIPSARDIPQGCRFHTRCPRKVGSICEQHAPPWQDAGDGHHIRCHIPAEELALLQTNPLPSLAEREPS